MTATLRQLIEEASTYTEAMFKPDDTMFAHILAIRPDGKRALMTCPMSSPEEEVWFRIKTPEALRRTGYQRWVFFSEAWMAEYPGGRRPEDHLPKNREDRIEIVTFAAEEAVTRERLVARRQIYRAEGVAGRLLPLVFSAQQAGFVIEGLPATAFGSTATGR